MTKLEEERMKKYQDRITALEATIRSMLEDINKAKRTGEEE